MEERERDQRFWAALEDTVNAMDRNELGRRLAGDIEVRAQLRFRRTILRFSNLREKIRKPCFILRSLKDPGKRHLIP